MKISRWYLFVLCLVFFVGACGGDETNLIGSDNNDNNVNNANNTNNANNANNLGQQGDRCTGGNECASGTCRFGACTGGSCYDGQQNGDETDVDCGAIGCALCSIGENCALDSHCVSGICDNNVCLDKNCEDGIQNGLETDVDCGTLCGACDDGDNCAEDTDCISGNCDDQCLAPTCDDEIANGVETDVDCGGPCDPCPDGLACDGDDDCTSEVCTGGLCAAPTCSDNTLNGDETDIDCGGATCDRCTNDQMCEKDEDCTNDLCDDDTNTCAAASCIDGVLNGLETDRDCGGADCNAVGLTCRPGRTCATGADCETGVCDPVIFECLQPTCMDGVENGDETDEDCGDRCGPCNDGDGCIEADDCLSFVCTGGTCQFSNCNDGALNNDETDVDCGGSCNKCAAGNDCNSAADCQSAVCENGSCREPRCNDGVQNGLETDVDCGGPDCPQCADGDGCIFGNDCTSLVCSSNTCLAPGCNDNTQNASETDVDCGGPDCPECEFGDACEEDLDCTTGICDGGPNLGPICAECSENSTRVVSNPCGYRQRGQVLETCRNGEFVATGCDGVWFGSCLEIKTNTPSSPDGMYTLDPDGPANEYSSFSVFCDMTTNGGGWTEILACTAKDDLQGELVAEQMASRARYEGCKPVTSDETGLHTYHFTFDFPAGFSQFFMSNYEARANADTEQNHTSDLGWFQNNWNAANGGQNTQRGDVSFGSGNAVGPVTSYSRHFGTQSCGDCVLTWSQFGPTTPFTLPGSATKFRIGWGESGPQFEGWYPWWSGAIRLR